MPRRWRCGLLTVIIPALSLLGTRTSAQDEQQAADTVVTIRGNVLCNRATDIKDWFWDPKDGDHTPVIYAMEGTSAIAKRVQTIMASYPDRGLDVEDALKIQDEFTRHLKYFIVAGPIADKIHKEVEAGSGLLALTGRISEKDGKKWIAVTRYQPSKVNYPAKMLAPDQPFAILAEKPLVLKIDGELTLKCLPLPAGRFLQGSPFYQRRYQDEYPHEVVLTKPFFMSEIPVTQEIFEAVMGKNPALSRGPRFPVERVPFADILEFCRRLSKKNGVTVPPANRRRVGIRSARRYVQSLLFREVQGPDQRGRRPAQLGARPKQEAQCLGALRHALRRLARYERLQVRQRQSQAGGSQRTGRE